MEPAILIQRFIDMRQARSQRPEIVLPEVEILLRGSTVRVLLSLLVAPDVVKADDNDEIVAELLLNEADATANVDVTDSTGHYYMKKENVSVDDKLLTNVEDIIDQAVAAISAKPQ